MSCKLRVLNANIIKIKFLQKCSLSQNIWPDSLTPGAWIKCAFEQRNSFIVCQVFAETRHDNLCLLNSNVGQELEIFEAPFLAEPQTLAIELLHKRNVKSFEAIIIITEQAYAHNIKYMNRARLAEILLLLQNLRVTRACTVKNADLISYGIDAVQLKAIVELADDNFYCVINKETHIKIADVQILYKPSKPITFHVYGFEQAKVQLQDLLKYNNFFRRNAAHKNRRLSSNVLLVGPTGSGKTALCNEFIAENNCNCFCINTARILGQYPGETEAELRKIFTAAEQFQSALKPAAPTVMLLDDLHLLCPRLENSSADAATSARISAQLLAFIDKFHARNLHIICLATSSAPDAINEAARRPGRFANEIEITAPLAESRKQLFMAFFKENLPEEHDAIKTETLDLVVAKTQGYVAADLCLLVHTIQRKLLHSTNNELNAVILSALEQMTPASAHSTDVSILKPTAGFDSIGGMQYLKRIFEVSVLASLKQQAAFQRFGLTLPKGVLLYGPPGCAKTTFAKCLAKEANMNFIATSGAEVYSPYVGCAEKFLAKMFTTARKNAPCLIFLDEIDSLVGRRTHKSAGGSGDVQMRILSTLLTEMDGIISGTANTVSSSQYILVVAATNRPDMVDDALMRPGRFDKLIHVPAPDAESRLAILKLNAEKMRFAKNVNLQLIAERTSNYSGADICSLCYEAGMKALERSFDANEISEIDFEQVLSAHKPSLNQQQIAAYLKFEQKTRAMN